MRGPQLLRSLIPFGVAVDAAGNPLQQTYSFNSHVRVLTPQTIKPVTMSIVSGNNQSAKVETALPSPLVLKIADSFERGRSRSSGHFHRRPR